ncbi:2'-5' RNA ligase family protein [Rhodoferax sp. WC2427]|uniref:2'-5' RNA ligase family protein n=1 Tax=Rhodoferax sp. WC2427 TaxID=3234144 RepID=UPI003467BDAD
MPQTGLIVRVAEAEPHVAHLRDRFHPVAKLGVPAHITVLYPFMPPERIDRDVVQRIQDAIAGIAAFPFTLGVVGRFPATAYLAPEPAAPFIALTQSLAQAFPDYPPFGGEFETIIPHLSVAHGSASDADTAQAELSQALAEKGPIHSVCSAVVLLENASGVWKQMQVFPLAPSPAADGPPR